MKIGLFFGSFNPIHIGHLIIAKQIVTQSDLDKVWFVVSPQNPFKKRSNLIHEFDRFDMVRRAVYDDSELEGSDVEFNLPKPSYTVDSLTYISEKFPKDEFTLVLGQDNLDHFHKWKNYEQILKYYKLIVYPRPNAKGSDLINHENVTIVEAPLLDISATFIRDRLKNNQSISYLVPKEVEEFILGKGLFKLK